MWTGGRGWTCTNRTLSYFFYIPGSFLLERAAVDEDQLGQGVRAGVLPVRKGRVNTDRISQVWRESRLYSLPFSFFGVKCVFVCVSSFDWLYRSMAMWKEVYGGIIIVRSRCCSFFSFFFPFFFFFGALFFFVDLWRANGWEATRSPSRRVETGRWNYIWAVCVGCTGSHRYWEYNARKSSSRFFRT